MRRDAHRAPRIPVLSPQNQLRGCSGKRQYGSFAEATKLAERLRRQAEEAIEAYKCRHCHHYHLGEPRQLPDKRKARDR